MSDVEEPPTKMSKYEEYLEEPDEGLEESLEEGQEEWLSEGVLTDDDYQSQITMPEHEKADSSFANTTQEDTDTMASIHEAEPTELPTQPNETKKDESDQRIEDTLTNLDGQNGLSEDLETFLIRKTDPKVVEEKPVEASEAVMNKEEDDGNDTDDLLRLLEDDQQVKKKAVKLVPAEKAEDNGSTDDDEFIYEQSKVKTLKVAKNALIKRVPSKAVPENMSDTDDETDTSDEGVTVKRIFGVKNIPTKPPSAKEMPRKVVKHVVHVKSNYKKIDKSHANNLKNVSTSVKPKVETRHFKQVGVKTLEPFKPIDKTAAKPQKPVKFEPKESAEDKIEKVEEFDEIIDEEEFLEEDDFELDEEEFGEDSEGENSKNSKKQRIMKPEVMDEEVPSDEDSHSEDGSLYDELPSSDSEDIDDWFTLDIRSERASDYIPLLGGCARALLAAELRRAGARVATLRHSLSALTDSARRQADTLRTAAMALAEIDDTLRAA